jgi:hypothetical protein
LLFCRDVFRARAQLLVEVRQARDLAQELFGAPLGWAALWEARLSSALAKVEKASEACEDLEIIAADHFYSLFEQLAGFALAWPDLRAAPTSRIASAVHFDLLTQRKDV